MDVYEKALLLHEQWQGKLSTELKANVKIPNKKNKKIIFFS